MNKPAVVVRKDNGMGWIVLSRPQVKNALSVASFDGIRAGIEELSLDPDVRVIILIGEGGNFSSGRDFKDSNVPHDFEERRNSAFNAVEYCRKPTIAAVRGYAITGGLTLAISCDIIIASENAIFRDTHAIIGAITLRASRLFEVLGPLKTKELLFTSRAITAREAMEMGLVNRVVADADLERTATEMAVEISRHNPSVVAAIKGVINDVIRSEQVRLLDLEKLEKSKFNQVHPEGEAMDRGLQGIKVPMQDR
jgi:enoyl-CoA hydratase/carnithine racemase